jgi:hypothetical protein
MNDKRSQRIYKINIKKFNKPNISIKRGLIEKPKCVNVNEKFCFTTFTSHPKEAAQQFVPLNK